MSKGNLTGKQLAFVNFYLGEANFNATEAARLAGYKGSYGSLRVIGHENITKLNIKQAIAARMEQIAMPANEVLVRLSEQARGSIEDLLDVEGYFIRDDLKKAKERGKLNLIKKITFNDFGGVKSFELHDPQAALVHLGKHHRLFDRAGEETPEMLAEARKALADFLHKHPNATREDIAPLYAQTFGVDESKLLN